MGKCPYPGQNVWTSSFCWICPSCDHRPHIIKTVSLITKEKYYQVLPATNIFSYTGITYWKRCLDLNLLTQSSVQKDSLPKLYPCIISLTKHASSFDVALFLPPSVDFPPFPQAYMGNARYGARVPPNSQKFTLFCYQKNVL